MVVYPHIYFGVLFNGSDTMCNSIRILNANLVTNQGFEFLNGPFPELQLVLGGRGVCAEVGIKQDLAQ